MDNTYQTFATKDDLHKVELKIELRISEAKSELKSEFKTEIAKVKYDLIKWMISLWIAQTVVFLGLFFRK